MQKAKSIIMQTMRDFFFSMAWYKIRITSDASSKNGKHLKLSKKSKSII
ncbi:MAG: hypothetical protein J6P28_02790 [Treponema sp.]|nr:hypothetical protein [Treponema sp.]